MNNHEQLGFACLSDVERRKIVGRKFGNFLADNGFKRVVYVGNIEDALPPAVRPALVAHGVPPSAYQGRMIGMSTALFPEFERTIFLQDPLFPAEKKFWQNIWRQTNISPPIITNEPPSVEDDSFFYPFIGSFDFLERYGNNSLPAAEEFNNKAQMKNLLRKLKLDHFIVPGVEIFYQGKNLDDLDDYVNEIIYQYLLPLIRAEQSPFLIKLGNTASGLLNIRVDPEMILVEDRETQHNQINEVFDQIEKMFKSPYDGKDYPGDVVIEQVIPFGKDREGWGDFSLRGFISPTGEFVFLSIGRVISNSKGEYLGMVMVESTSKEQLRQIGLQSEQLQNVVSVSQRIANEMFERGYFGPYSIDFFCPQNAQEQSSFLIHDFNMREGGTTISGLITSISEVVFGEKTPVLDIELKMKRKEGGVFSEGELNDVLEELQRIGIFPYATTFLRYPTKEGVYTVKLLLAYPDEALTDDQVADFIRRKTEDLNNKFNNVAFLSTL